MSPIFLEIGIIIVIATIISIAVRALKQPFIIGYIITGILAGPYLLGLAGSREVVDVLSQIGISLLLFIVGLSLNPKVIRDVGKIALISGIGQVIFTSIVGFFIASFLGFSPVTSIYIAVALTFSSTIIIMKLLSDRHELDTLYGKIAIGFLLVQDMVAFLILMLISSLSSGTSILNSLLMIILESFLIIAFLYFFSSYILPRIGKFIAQSQEFLFLFSLGWMFAMAALFSYLNLSSEIGALLAGIALSASSYSYEISSKIRPLRDFFLMMFFIILGTQVSFEAVRIFIIPVLVFSLFVLIGNPILMMAIMGFLGYTKKNSFLVGLTVAQISEFSLILIVLGIKEGHIGPEILPLITMVGIVTIAGSAYMIMYSQKIYPFISNYLNIFERKGRKKDAHSPKNKTYDIILAGHNRIGFDLLKSFRKMKKRFLVIDYNPETIDKLSRKKYNCAYGDANDIDFLNGINFKDARLVVSTIPVLETNMLLLSKAKQSNPKAIVIIVSHQIEDSLKLYEQGASYVLMPHFLGGHYASKLIESHLFNSKKFSHEKKQHLKILKERREEGHEHPKTEKYA